MSNSHAKSSNPPAAHQSDSDLEAAIAQAQATVATDSSQPESLQSSLQTLQATIASFYQRYSELVASHDFLEQDCATFQSFYEQAPWGLLGTDWDGVVRHANAAAARLLQVEREQLIGRSLSEFAQLEQANVISGAIAQLQQGISSSALEFRLRAAFDQPLYLFMEGRVIPMGSHGLPLLWQVADISSRKQSELALQQQLAQAHLTNLVIQRIRQSLDPAEILNQTVTELLRVLQTDRVVIHSVESQGPKAIAEALQKGYRSMLDQAKLAEITEFSAELYRTGQPLILEDVETLPNPTQVVDTLRQMQIRAMVMVPIRREGKLLGLLSVHQCQAVRSWTLFEINLLQQVAEQVAIALHHSRMYQQAQQLNANLEEEVQRRTEQMSRVLKYESMLKRITERVRDSLDPNQILQAAVQELTVVLGLAGCNAALYNLDQNTSTILYEYTDSLPAFYGKVARMEDSPDIYSQLKQGLNFQFCSLYPNPVRGSVAMLACPIFVDPNSSEGMEQTVLGDLWLLHSKTHVFNEFEIRLAQQVASQCAIAIRQARLYHAAQAQVQELERLNQLKDQFLSTVSHELRTPIANLKMALHMMRISTNPEKQQQYLHILDTELAREADLINDLLDLQRMEEFNAGIALTSIAVQRWVLDQIDPFRSRLQNYQQTFTLYCPDDLPPLITDVTILQRILAELFNNACKYTPKGAAIELHISTAPAIAADATATATFLLRNEAEIPQQELPYIFQKFYRVLQVDRYKHGGTGLGLALVEKLTEQLHGSIQVESKAGWTEFRLTIPSPAIAPALNGTL